MPSQNHRSINNLFHLITIYFSPTSGFFHAARVLYNLDARPKFPKIWCTFHLYSDLYRHEFKN